MALPPTAATRRVTFTKLELAVVWFTNWIRVVTRRSFTVLKDYQMVPSLVHLYSWTRREISMAPPHGAGTIKGIAIPPMSCSQDAGPFLRSTPLEPFPCFSH